MSITTDYLHDAIIETCRAHFGPRCHYGRYQIEDPDLEVPNATLESPPLILRLEDSAAVEVTDYPDCLGAFWVDVGLLLVCVLSVESAPNVQLKLAEFAHQAMALVQAENPGSGGEYGNRWGISAADIGYPQAVSQGPLDIGLQGRDCRAVRWTQRVAITRAIPF